MADAKDKSKKEELEKALYAKTITNAFPRVGTESTTVAFGKYSCTVSAVFPHKLRS